MNATGRTCVVTGATSGIGWAVTRQLVAAGDTVVGLARDADKLAIATAEFGAAFIPLQVDVTDADQVDSVFAEIPAIDVLVASAGRCDRAALDAPNASTLWHELLAVNLSGSFHCMRAAQSRMGAHAAMVAVSSGLGKLGRAGYAAYAASKHGLLGLTKSVAAELAPRRINVNAVCPGWVDTPMAAADVARVAEETKYSAADVRAQTRTQIPLGRFVAPEEVAALIVWLASPAASAITGQAYNISGGEFFA